MAASKVQLNWANVTHGTTAISGVSNITFNAGGKLLKYSADNDRFTRLAVHSMSEPTAKVDSADTATIMGIGLGTAADFKATHKDANAQIGGDILYTLTGAVVENNETSGAHGAYGTASLMLAGVSADGQTNPLSFTRV